MRHNAMGILGLTALVALFLHGCFLFERAEPEYLTNARIAVERASEVLEKTEAAVALGEENLAKIEALAAEHGAEKVAAELADARQFLAEQRAKVPAVQQWVAEIQALATEAEQRAKEDGGMTWGELLLVLGEGALAAFGLGGYARIVGTARRMVVGIQKAREGLDPAADQTVLKALNDTLVGSDAKFVSKTKAKLNIASVTDARPPTA